MFCSVNERSNFKNNFCLEKPRGWSARRVHAFCAMMVILPEVVQVFEKNIDRLFKVYSTKCMCKHMIPIMATGK